MLLPIHVDHPEPRKIQRAVDALQSGEVIAYPTDTVYGLGCDMMNKKAIDRLYAIKQMAASHPLAFICPDLANIAKYALVENAMYRVLRHFLPGPYCFILPASHEVPRLMQSKRKTVGIRIPRHPVACALARELGRPIVSTSAQREGEDPHVDPREIDHAFRGLGMVLDGGGGGLVPTTVIDLTRAPPEIVRRGAGSTEEFE
jgi:tRNA threonylcarbamoyl adenosine modification protein (Sua5/YciO/YrdC/YwlC family)